MSLKERTLNSLGWTILERIGVRTVTFGVQILLARILLPEEFGIVSTVAIILIIARVLTEGGLGSAIIQNQKVERIDISTVFFLNLLISCVVFVGLTAMSPWFADFFEKPELRNVLPVLAVGIVIAAFGQIQVQMLNKNMEFKRLLKISLPSTILSGIAGIGMALAGFGVWALVGLRLVQNFVFTVTVWMFCNPEWRPRFEFSFGSVRKLAGFGFARLFTNLTFQTTRNLYGLVIAKAYGMSDLAFYNRAQSFQKQPVTAIVSSLNRVMFPVFSEIQHDNARMRTALRKGIPAIVFIVIPAMVLLMTVAEPLIQVLLTEKWIESVPYLQICPLLGICYCVNSIKMNVITGKGNPKLIFALGVIRPGLQLLVLWLTWKHGVMAILIGQVAVPIFNTFFINDIIIRRIIDFPLRQQWSDWLPYFGVSAVAAGLASLLNLAPLPLPILQLIAQTLIFTIIYLGLCYSLKLSGMAFVIDRAKRIRNGKQAS
ncbi:MAG: lipopolysaccharide biosynthesis protein [Planctomycetota bacterium]